MKLDYPKATSIDNAIPCGQWGKNNVPIYHLQSATALNQLVGYVKFKTVQTVRFYIVGKEKITIRCHLAAVENRQLLFLMRLFQPLPLTIPW